MELYTRQDEAFLNRITSVIEANLADENFGVSQLAHEVGLSRSQIYRKLKTDCNKSISQFIREIRLKKAKEILQVENLTVSEVAYNTGFGSPSYFIKCFHEYFGYAPGEMKKSLIDDESLLKQENFSYQKKIKRKFRIVLFSTIIIVIIATGWFIYRQIEHAEKNQLSIIVLPFKNLSEDPANEYFADGIREDILNNLYWITSLRVVSNTTAENFRENTQTAHEIARQMNVNYVLEGSVRRYGDKAKINIQLIDPKRDDHLWASSFDRDLSDIIQVQNEIALQIADKLKTVITDNEIRRIEKISTQNPKAYDYYLQARFLLHQANSSQRSGFNASGVINSVEYYKKAIAEDPGFAEAYAGMANATTQLTAWGIARDTGMLNKVYKLCQEALRCDPDCAEAHALLGLNYWGRHNFEKSGEELRRSIDLNPNFASARQWYAQHLMMTGPISEARKQVNRAVDLEPYFWVVKNLDSWIAYFEKDYKRSLEVSQVAHYLNPDFSSNMWLVFLNNVKLNQSMEACDQLKAIAKKYSRSDDYAAEIDEAFAIGGIKGLLTCMIDINKNKPIRVEGLTGESFYIAWWYAILQNKEETFYWLEKTISNKIAPYHYLNLIINHPDFEFIKDDPRFFIIVDKLGLSAYYKQI